jgi:hypothetical protein
VPTASLYIDREGCGVLTILVGTKKRCPKLNTEVTFHRNSASLAYSTRIRCSERYTSPCFCPWARPGLTTCSHIAIEPCESRIDKQGRAAGVPLAAEASKGPRAEEAEEVIAAGGRGRRTKLEASAQGRVGVFLEAASV